MKIDVLTKENKAVGTVEADDRIFAEAWNPTLVQQVLQSQRANRRRAWAHAKDRSEVRGGGRKPWRQKGTGRARHGSIRSPIWVGGGKAHGPLTAKNYKKKVNKKMRRKAVCSVLSRKLADNEVSVVDQINLEEKKTKYANRFLQGLFGEKDRMNVLIVRNPDHKDLTKAVRNINKAYVIDPTNINVEDLLSYKTILFEKGALDHLSYLYE